MTVREMEYYDWVDVDAMLLDKFGLSFYIDNDDEYKHLRMWFSENSLWSDLLDLRRDRLHISHFTDENVWVYNLLWVIYDMLGECVIWMET